MRWLFVAWFVLMSFAGGEIRPAPSTVNVQLSDLPAGWQLMVPGSADQGQLGVFHGELSHTRGFAQGNLREYRRLTDGKESRILAAVFLLASPGDAHRAYVQQRQLITQVKRAGGRRVARAGEGPLALKHLGDERAHVTVHPGPAAAVDTEILFRRSAYVSVLFVHDAASLFSPAQVAELARTVDARIQHPTG